MRHLSEPSSLRDSARRTARAIDKLAVQRLSAVNSDIAEPPGAVPQPLTDRTSRLGSPAAHVKGHTGILAGMCVILPTFQLLMLQTRPLQPPQPLQPQQPLQLPQPLQPLLYKDATDTAGRYRPVLDNHANGSERNRFRVEPYHRRTGGVVLQGDH